MAHVSSASLRTLCSKINATSTSGYQTEISSSSSTSSSFASHSSSGHHLQNSTLALRCSTSLITQTTGNGEGSHILTSMETTVMGALLLLVFLASLVANAFVFVVFCKRKSLSMSNRFVANLTVCNCLNTLLIMPFAFVSLLAKGWIFGSFWCMCTGFFMNVFVSASIFTLVVISIDRYFAVVTPLHYTMRLTSRRCMGMILVIWVAAVLVAFPPLVGWNNIRFQSDKIVCTVMWSNSSSAGRSYTFFLISSSFLLPLIAMLWTYARIFRAARNNSVRTRRNSMPRIQQTIYHNNTLNPLNSCSTSNSSGGGGGSDDLSSQTTPINGRRRSSAVPIIRRFSQSSSRSSSLLWRLEEWKAAVTSFLVLFSFALCWTPYFVVMAMEAITGSARPLEPPISLSSTVMAMFSCACNPLVYVFRSKIVRKELRRIFKGSRACGNGNIYGHSICVPNEYMSNALARKNSVIRNDSGRSLKSLDEEILEESRPTLNSSNTESTLVTCDSSSSFRKC